jgi:hypothetical protein
MEENPNSTQSTDQLQKSDSGRGRRSLLSLPAIPVIAALFSRHLPHIFIAPLMLVFFLSPLLALYTLGIMIYYIKKEDGLAAFLSFLLLVPLICASCIAIIWLTHGIQLET